MGRRLRGAGGQAGRHHRPERRRQEHAASRRCWGWCRSASGEVRDVRQAVRRSSGACVGYVPQRESVDWDFPDQRARRGADGQLRPARLVFAGRRGADRETRAALPGAGRHGAIRPPADQPALRRAAAARVPGPRAGPGGDSSTSWTSRSPASTPRPSRRSSSCCSELRERGKTVFVVHHDLRTVREYFDWVMLLNMRLVAVRPGRPRSSPTRTCKDLRRPAAAAHRSRRGDPSRRPVGRDVVMAEFVDISAIRIQLGAARHDVARHRRRQRSACFALLRRRALLGDTLSHAALPGVCLAFLAHGSKHPLVAAARAPVVTGWLGVSAVNLIMRSQPDQGGRRDRLTLSVFFGAGIVLLTLHPEDRPRPPGGARQVSIRTGGLARRRSDVMAARRRHCGAARLARVRVQGVQTRLRSILRSPRRSAGRSGHRARARAAHRAVGDGRTAARRRGADGGDARDTGGGGALLDGPAVRDGPDRGGAGRTFRALWVRRSAWSRPACRPDRGSWSRRRPGSSSRCSPPRAAGSSARVVRQWQTRAAHRGREPAQDVLQDR